MAPRLKGLGQLLGLNRCGAAGQGQAREVLGGSVDQVQLAALTAQTDLQAGVVEGQRNPAGFRVGGAVHHALGAGGQRDCGKQQDGGKHRAPDRADALVQRARSYAQSRGVCGVHWKSDIEAGRLVGSTAVARLQTNEVFLAQVAEARKEVAKARAAGQVPAAADCAAEAAALSLSTQLAP